MAIETTQDGYQKPDGNELVRGGDNVIAANAQKAQDHYTAVKADALTLANRLGIAEAKINAGAGGPGLSEDPDHPGLYYFAGPGFAADPLHPGLYTLQEETP
ncbi:hypothetical protein PBI_ISOLDE_29 [Arthrobacter phage Isolde]|uniref:Uncharacterized protein n=1 Tax=Arthrobacter phage Isolde TaxID=2419610 RepID=A0A3G3M4R7_9CAUD|nr:hypothetical protein PP638_gp74 [Arthrobacter phage Isolde]AYR00998.1 hypothetical protein PBI_ISOLDE_29 [Arthrobacter phage Isolde]